MIGVIHALKLDRTYTIGETPAQKDVFRPWLISENET